MSHINKKRGNTKLEIIRLAAHLFIEEGYSQTTINKIAKTLDLSPGNITFYFPTKEHLLAVLADELFDYQIWLMEYEAHEGASSLLSYCLELTSIAAACEDDAVARDFFASSYSSPMILNMIRENDAKKTKRIFAQYHPEWSDDDWRATENIVSGSIGEAHGEVCVRIHRSLLLPFKKTCGICPACVFQCSLMGICAVLQLYALVED